MATADQARQRRARQAIAKLKSSSNQPTSDIADVLHDYEERFLMCRDLGHNWKIAGLYRLGGGIRRRLLCTRCPTTRTDEWGSRGTRVGNRYAYPEGYQIQGTGGVDRTAVRMEIMNRFTIFDNEADMITATTTTRRKKAS